MSQRPAQQPVIHGRLQYVAAGYLPDCLDFDHLIPEGSQVGSLAVVPHQYVRPAGYSIWSR